MNANTVTLDVREDLRRGQEPFAKIMGAVARLESDQALLLIAPFEPAPLYAVLGRQGFSHQSKALPNGDYEVRFERGPAAAPAANPAATPTVTARKAKVFDVDARGLEPPQPLVVILEAVVDLPPDAELRARTDRKPMHLYSELLERGFTGQTDEQPDGSFITLIRRR